MLHSLFRQVTVNRKRKLDQFTSHNTLKLHDFIARKKAKLRATLQGKQNKKVGIEEKIFKGVKSVPTKIVMHISTR